MAIYQYMLRGRDGSKETWACQGVVESDGLIPAIELAQARSFEQLTAGKAEYGKPGLHGCKGPYKFTHLLVQEETPDMHRDRAMGLVEQTVGDDWTRDSVYDFLIRHGIDATVAHGIASDIHRERSSDEAH